MIAIASLLVFLLKLLLFLTAALLVLLILLLTIPIGYSLSAVIKGSLIANADAHWAVLGVSVSVEDWSTRVKMSIFGREIRLRRAEKKIRDKTEEKKRKGWRRKPGIEFFREALSFLKEILEVLEPREIHVKGCYGLDDPADTAALSSLVLACGRLSGARIELHPVFESEVIDISLWLAGRVVPIILVFIAVKYLLKKEVRRVLIFREE